MKKQMIMAMATGLALMAATPALAQQGATTATTAGTGGPILSFAVDEEVRAAPDRAAIGAGVTNTAPTAVEALRANSAAMEKLVAAVKARGIKAENIQTSGINLSPQYDYNNQGPGQPPRFIGYQVSNTVRVTTDDVAKLGELLDALVAAGGTNVDGPTFSVKDADAMLAPARATAFAEAGEKAADYARLAGYSRAELVSVTEGGGYSGPRPIPFALQANDARAESKAVIEPGQVGNTLTLQFQYRLVR